MKTQFAFTLALAAAIATAAVAQAPAPIKPESSVSFRIPVEMQHNCYMQGQPRLVSYVYGDGFIVHRKNDLTALVVLAREGGRSRADFYRKPGGDGRALASAFSVCMWRYGGAPL